MNVHFCLSTAPAPNVLPLELLKEHKPVQETAHLGQFEQILGRMEIEIKLMVLLKNQKSVVLRTAVQNQAAVKVK